MNNVNFNISEIYRMPTASPPELFVRRVHSCSALLSLAFHRPPLSVATMLGFLALLASAAAYKPHSLLRWRRRALATRLRATRSLALPLELDDWAPARYASPMEFLRPMEAAEHAARALRVPAALRDVANPYGMHSHLAMTLFGAAAASERTFFSSPAREPLLLPQASPRTRR